MKNKRFFRRILAGISLAAAITVATVLVVFSLGSADPSVNFNCLTFKVAEDGSIQALVTITAENIPYLASMDFSINYNEKYFVPSDALTNEALAVPNNSSIATQAFFQQDNSLYLIDSGGNKVSPFLKEPSASSGSLKLGLLGTDGTDKLLSMALYMDNKIRPQINGSKVKWLPQYENEAIDGSARLAILADGTVADKKGAVIGTLSFRVDPAYLSEMVQKFNANGIITNPAPGEKAYLLGLSGKLQSNDVWVVMDYYYDDWGAPSEVNQRTYTKSAPTTPDGKTMHINFNFNFPKVLVTADLAEDNVTINAYDAYTNGNITDLAAALRKYSPTVRAGYADGSFEDFVIPWGAADAKYEYKVYRVDGSGNETLLAPGDYDAKGGKYRVEQHFFYTEDGVEKKYPMVRSVNLTVTPVTALGVSGTNLNKTYLNTAGSVSPVPAITSRLELPDEAVLAVSPAPAAASLTLPLALSGWTNHPDDLSQTKALDGTSWPIDSATNTITFGAGAGTYEFTQPLARADIETAYPWLTVPSDYTLTATRVIVVNPGEFVDEGDYAVTATRVGSSGENAAFTVTRSGAPLNAGSTVKLYLPNGQEVAASDYTYDTASSTITTIADDIYDTALRRYLNLGGWFVVTIQENGVAGVTEKPVFLALRDNLYLEDRVGDKDAATGNLGRFDFSGDLAGIFPYQRSKGLGSSMVLPVGYYVDTTYDGATGAPGGRLSTVKATWESTDPVQDTTNTDLYTYGPQDYDSARFDGYGLVTNPATDLKRVEIRVEDDQDKDLGGITDLTLTCAPGSSGAALTEDGQVAGIVYDTRQVGYRVRQEFTLILTNTGTKDIHGLRLDLPTDSKYEIIKAPATYLAPGMSTTFIITYVYGLTPDVHLETIHITTAQSDLADKTFTARFRVIPGAIRKVQVVTNSPVTAATPPTPIMGVAGIATGLAEGTPGAVTTPKTTGADLPSAVAGPIGYEAGYKYVWIRSETFDMYEIGEVYYYESGTANKVYLTEYEYTGENGEGEQVRYWFFLMPDDDVTVHVDFVEPDVSKLRLSAIIPEAKKDAGSMTLRTLRRWDNSSQIVNGDPLTEEESGLDHFLVVLDDDDAQAQLTIRLRQVIALIPGNDNIPVNVLIKNMKDGVILKNEAGDTAAPTTHVSLDFKAPDAGESVDIVVTVSCVPLGATAEVARSVTVTFSKPPKELAYMLEYGNSPYGMIMNSSLSDASKAFAKAEFVKTYSFTNQLLTPDKAKNNGLKNIYYTEAWGAGTNYDLADTALFVYPGEDFLDPGVSGVKDFANRPVAAADINRTVKVTLLEDSATAQADRFSGGETITLDLGTADTAVVTDWWKDPVGGMESLIRPGVYTLVYTFTDYDGTTKREIERPLIILPRNGDVTADRTVGESDAKTIENRVSDPLGYTADEADYPDRRLFQYRVCDVNNDENFNNIDANLARDSGDIVFFYEPVDYK
ncbi:exported hypothetical protein [uncultured Eubacteriales bacterium]|uniref:Uncharacterized protein n=1 Tax=uncultured Eubacteriales bacterium TaxID=172733 RepID=A0A212IWA8_9FIRM|nr:exported hypothetical protein [uncultured Eubacteriales bacterium]